MGEERSFHSDKTAGRVGRLLAQFYGDWNRRRCGDLLHEFGIEADKAVEHLSRSRQTLLAIAARGHRRGQAVADASRAACGERLRARLALTG